MHNPGGKLLPNPFRPQSPERPAISPPRCRTCAVPSPHKVIPRDSGRGGWPFRMWRLFRSRSAGSFPTRCSQTRLRFPVTPSLGLASTSSDHILGITPMWIVSLSLSYVAVKTLLRFFRDFCSARKRRPGVPPATAPPALRPDTSCSVKTTFSETAPALQTVPTAAPPDGGRPWTGFPQLWTGWWKFLRMGEIRARSDRRGCSRVGPGHLHQSPSHGQASIQSG